MRNMTHVSKHQNLCMPYLKWETILTLKLLMVHFQETIQKIGIMSSGNNSQCQIFNYKKCYDIKGESAIIYLHYMLMIVLDIYSSRP